jgi:cytochrome c oxidase subunit II
MTRRSSARLVVPALFGAFVTGCAGAHSITEPRSPEARSINRNYWLLFWLAVGVYAVVITLVLVAMAKRRTTAEPQRRQRFDNRFIAIGGLTVPILILGVVAVVTVRVANDLSPAGASASAPVQITVEGRDWWWRIEYPNDGVVTANEIHVPVGQAVDITLISADVIHSLWIPELNGKQDLVPGQVNHLRFTADTVGKYLGRCAEFCGIQHARMLFVVFVDSQSDYRAWLDTNRAPAKAPTGGQPEHGEQILTTTACAGCHTVRGTAADGTVGPDLTHVASRSTIAAGVLPNTPADMRHWLDKTQTVKHGALMPELDLSNADLDALVAYLEGLK